MVKQQLHVAKLSGWINFRYYIIEMNNRVYVIDYANPKDIRHYFPGFFPKQNRQYTVYDITASKEEYSIKPIPWWQTPIRPVIDMFIFFVFVSIGMITMALKIHWLYNENTFQFWRHIVLIYLIGIFLIIFGLNKSAEAPHRLFEEKIYQIERKPQPIFIGKKRKTKVGPVKEFIQTLIGWLIPLPFIFNMSYFVVFLAIIGSYSIFFIRFLNIYDVLHANKFIFLKEQD